MPWSDDTRCLYCNGKLPLYRRLKQGQFCSQAHHQEYEAQNERLGLERLFETHSNLQAARPKVSAESILGPEPVGPRRPEAQPVSEPRPRMQAEDIELFVAREEVVVAREPEPVPVPGVVIPSIPSGPGEGECRHCGKKLPLFQKLKHGQFCSKAHQAEFAKAQDLLGLERLFETHSNLQALRPAAGAESILGPAPSTGPSPYPAEPQVAAGSWVEPWVEPSVEPVMSAPAASASSIPDYASIPGYASKLEQRPPNVVSLPPAMAVVDPLHYEANPQPQSARLDSHFDYGRAALAVLTPSFAERVHVDSSGQLGSNPGIRGERADVVESLGTLGRNMGPSVLQAAITPADAEPFTGSVAIAAYPQDTVVVLAPFFAGRVEVVRIEMPAARNGADLSAPRMEIEPAAAFTGSIAFAAHSLSTEFLSAIPPAASLLAVPTRMDNALLTSTALNQEAAPLEWPELGSGRVSLVLGEGLVANAAVRTPVSVGAVRNVTIGLLDSADAPSIRPLTVAFDQGESPTAWLLPTSDANKVPLSRVLGDPSLNGLVSLVWGSTGSAVATVVPSGSESEIWHVTVSTEVRALPPMSIVAWQPGIRDDLRCMSLPFAGAGESSASAKGLCASLGMTGAEEPTPAAPARQPDRKLDLAGDAAYSLLAQVCAAGETLLHLPPLSRSNPASVPIAPRAVTDGGVEFHGHTSQDVVKPSSVVNGRFEIPSLVPPPGDIVALPLGKGSSVALLPQPIEAMSIALASNAQIAGALGRVASGLGSLQPRKSSTRSCKLLQPLMVLFRLAYLRNSKPIEFARRVQGSVPPESEPGQAILPKFRGRPESSLGEAINQVAAGPMESAARPAVGAVSAWTGFWHNAPRDLKILLVTIPLLAALAFSPGIPKVSLHAPGGDGISERMEKAVSLQLASLRKTVLERAAVALDEDFRQGLDEWVGKGGATTEWSFDETGFVRPGPLALYRPSRGLTDYKMEFLGLIDNKALSWVVRAVDFQNYYVIKLVVVKPGQVPELQLTRYAVIDGKPEDRKDTPVYLRGRGDLPYRVSVNLEGDKFSVYVQNLLMDSWNEPRLMHGGIGFFTAHGEQSRVRWVQVTHQYDTLGRLCAFLAPNEFSNNPEER